MEKLKIPRLLTASEIDVRVGAVYKNGCTLLLYQNARVGMQILDEMFGNMWQCSYSRDNANCTISAYFEGIGWVSREDTGTESYTEKEKGLASDSFKRACVKWGIGRELYTAPLLWVSCTAEERNGRPALPNNVQKAIGRCKVAKIIYNEDRSIRTVIVTNYGDKTFPIEITGGERLTVPKDNMQEMLNAR